MKKVLILAPHTDDGELGCGATISKFIRLNYEVYYIAFSSCKDSIPKGLPEDTLKNELYNATDKLGIKKENVILFEFKVRCFEKYRQEILDSMIQINSSINPDVVFSPSIHDVHQDHYVVASECLRAFKKKTILQYETPWNNYSFNNQVFIKVEKKDVENKIASINCYESQKHRDYTKKEFVESLLITHGVQIGEEYAEVFETPRVILL